MADTVANFSIDASPNGGVRGIYSCPGDGINSITTTLRKARGTKQNEAGSHKVV